MSKHITVSTVNANRLRELEAAAHRWRRKEFYTSAVVLGLDIGLEGIGVCIRRGHEIIYAKTLQYDVPEAARLENRRQKRAWRHCRANRKTRMYRLKGLFAEHGLPWLDEKSPGLLHSDPFVLRHRAVTGRLASKEALSIAIRHCVAHRGYDYDYFNDEGAYPWGNATEAKKVIKELGDMWLTPEDAAKARRDATGFDWRQDEVEEFERVLSARTAGPEKINERLAAHARQGGGNCRIRAKGEAYPRRFVWLHLKEIINRHEHLIEDVAGFVTALSLKPTDAGSKERAIFYFHRKTPEEMRAHFETKKASCPYAAWLGLPTGSVANRAHLSIRLFSLLEFAATRDIELLGGRRVPLGEEQTQKLLDWVKRHPEARTLKEAKPVLDELVTSLAKTFGSKVAPQSGKNKSELNVCFFTILRDLLAPGAANRNQNASMSAVSADRLFSIATTGGLSREAVVEALRDYYDARKRRLPDLYGVYPQVEFLLGQRVKKERTRHGKTRGMLAHPGQLQRIFAELAERLDGAAAPDFCVVEVARDLPRNQKQKAEREKEIGDNRKRREDLFKKFGLTDDAKGSARRRVELFDQQRGVCPFTGKELGGNPLAEDLDIEHLYPQESGGLTVNENLVLTFKAVNARKAKRTPREFATSLGVPFEEMVQHSTKMQWGKFKCSVFSWEKPDEIPAFGNTTRVSQLATQLSAELADWMGIQGIADAGQRENERARRIGTPTGFFTAACRRAWELPIKDRADLTHHLVDAVILSHIPPREGQNYLASGGIFFPEWDMTAKRQILGVLPLGPLPEQVARITAADAEVCPILRHRSSSNARSIHDETQWRVREDGALVAREELPAKDTLDPAKLRQKLIDSGIPLTYRDVEGTENPLIPSTTALERWLNSGDDSPLRLLNGTPVRSVWKFSGKGDLEKNPAGFHARRNEQGNLAGVKAIGGRWQALELWRGWDAKRGRWSYFKQLVPSKEVLRGRRAMGISWKKKGKRPWRSGTDVSNLPLKKLLAGSLPPFACRAVHPDTHKPVVLHLDDTCLAGLAVDGKLAKRGQTPARREWLRIAAVMAEGGGRLRFVSLVHNDGKRYEPMSADDLACLAGLPPADDSSSYPRQRAPGPARAGGTADLRLE